MNKAIRVLILVLTVYLVFLGTGWAAERVILENGNELTGEIVEETNEYIVLSTMEGKGRTKIFKSDIADIVQIQKVEKTPPAQEQVPAEKEAAAPVIKKTTPGPAGLNAFIVYLFGAVGVVVLALILLFFVIRNRPVGIKIIFLLNGAGYIVVFLTGIMLWPFITLRGAGILGGLELSRFLWLVFSLFVLPAAGFSVLFHLFHLRSWARIGFLGVLAAGLMVYVIAFFMQNQPDFFRPLVAAGNMGIALPEMGGMTHKVGSLFSLVLPVFWALANFIYLNMPRTKKYFEEPMPVSMKGIGAVLVVVVLLLWAGDMAYRSMFVRLSGRQDLFTLPLRTQGALDRPASVSRYEAKSAGGIRFFLPSGMKLFEKSDAGYQVVFMDKQKGRYFTIGAMEEKEFRLYSLLAYARWNPLLLLLKAIAMHSPRGVKLVFSKEIVFSQGVLFLKLFDGKDGRMYDYMLRRNNKCFNGLIGGDSKDEFVGEQIALEIISLIE